MTKHSASPLVEAGHVCGACGQPRYHVVGCGCRICSEPGVVPITVDPSLRVIENLARAWTDERTVVAQLRVRIAMLEARVQEIGNERDRAHEQLRRQS